MAGPELDPNHADKFVWQPGDVDWGRDNGPMDADALTKRGHAAAQAAEDYLAGGFVGQALVQLGAAAAAFLAAGEQIEADVVNERLIRVLRFAGFLDAASGKPVRHKGWRREH